MELIRGGSVLTTILPFLFLLFNSGNAIKCYQCVERPQSHESHLSCSYFDKSRKFHADCEHSTFCMKRASYLELNNGSLISIHVHKCADQAQKTVIEDENGNFNWGKIIHKCSITQSNVTMCPNWVAKCSISFDLITKTQSCED
ncbi:unnamed protein product [Allacma fusca]|uniref:Protein quiver n=1 Tax=Allacma fusca TaxID=39272 RepID=A0A8J2NXG2_9HEXA|nr:unnamed protein product [Allacma fusca]